jgi:hypothetical protein
MDEAMTQQMAAAADRMANAAEMFDRVLERLDAQYQSLNLKVDRIVAAIEEGEEPEEPTEIEASENELQQRVVELERANTELKAQSSRLARKTLPALVSAVLGKNDLEAGERIDAGAIEKSLQALSVEQRIAVKAEMARAGIIE